VTTLAAVLVVVWIGVLTIVVLLLVRQVGLVTVRLDLRRDLDAPIADGIGLGTEIGPSVARHVDAEKAYVLILGAVCGPCRELALDLSQQRFAHPVVAFISGSAELAQGIADLLPSGMNVVLDPEALVAVQELEIETTPFVFQIEGGRVTAKAALRGAEHLLRFVESPNTALVIEPELQVVTHGH
jgi:hypothetical protein